jgi:hypothetical protein
MFKKVGTSRSKPKSKSNGGSWDPDGADWIPASAGHGILLCGSVNWAQYGNEVDVSI